ncbi:hypothetical protein Csa_012350, partial [Cucumis sativus]
AMHFWVVPAKAIAIAKESYSFLVLKFESVLGGRRRQCEGDKEEGREIEIGLWMQKIWV